MTTPTTLPALEEGHARAPSAPPPPPERPRPFLARLACGFVLVYLTLYNLPFRSTGWPWAMP